MDGVTAIANERAHQLSKGYTTAHDDGHGAQRLVDAALAYTVQAQDIITDAAGEGVGADGPSRYWPWDIESFQQDDDELESLAKAGALIAAAYDAAQRRREYAKPVLRMAVDGTTKTYGSMLLTAEFNARLMASYQGKWVAFRDSQVVAHADDLKGLHALLTEHIVVDPVMVIKVPTA